MDPSARKLNLYSLLGKKFPATFPAEQISAKPRFMHFLSRYDAAVLTSSLNHVHVLLQPIDAENAPATGTINWLHINGRVISEQSEYVASILE
ncbi:hypothetical protein D3C76_1721960 [compost metagenome]